MHTQIKVNKNSGEAIYKQIADQLRKMIAEKTLRSGDRLPPEPEFARQLQITRATLRKSLQILMDERLLVKLPSKGTFILPASERKHRIGIVFHKGMNKNFDWYSSTTVSAISTAVKNYENCGTSLLSIEENETADQFFMKAIRSGVEGSVAVISSVEDGKILSDPVFAGLPIVVLGLHELPGVPSVDLDDAQMEPAIRRLVELGHRKIAYISCCSSSAHSISRDKNFLQLRERYHLDSNPDYYVRCDQEKPWFDQAMEATGKLLSVENPPTAILSNSRNITIGVWNQLLMSGCRIPEDISVIGFDCHCMGNPLIATLEQPVKQMAEKCVDLLFERIEQGRWNPDAHYNFSVILHEGKSIGVCHEPR